MPDEHGAPHLDDEALNAVLDREAATEEEDHARSCLPCADRLARFAAVASTVAAPVEAPSAEHRQAAVSLALDAAPGPVPDRVDGSEQEEQAPRPFCDPLVLAERRRPRVPAAGWAVAAASVAALGLAIPLFNRSTASDQAFSQDRATRSAAEDSGAGGSVADDCPACGSALESGPVDAGDLGDLDQTGVEALARNLDHASSSPEVRPESGEALLDQSGEPGAAAPGPTGEASRSGSHLGSAPPAPAPAAAPAGPVERCEVSARERDSALGPLTYTARARFRGVEAVVLGFGSSAPRPGTPGPGPALVLVLAAGDCGGLAAASA